MHQLRIVGVIAAMVHTVSCAPPRPIASVTTPSVLIPIPLVYDDVANFAAAFAALAGGGDTAAILQRNYIDRATPGLRLYLTKYPYTAAQLAAAIQRFPQDYAGVAKRLEWLRSQRDSIGQLYAAFARRVPIVATLPLYFVVGVHTGTASGSEVGALISVENGAGNAVRANLSEFIAHELTHIQQFSTIGMPNYQALFGPRKSLLGLTIREGIAELVADLVTGKMTQERARPYLRDNLPSIWREFRKEMCGTETGDWMFRRPANPQQPSFVAYVLGAEIARSYYDGRPDKRQAIIELLAVDDYPAFLVASGFAAARGESVQDLTGLLHRCPR